MVAVSKNLNFWQKFLVLSRLPRAVYLFQVFIGVYLFKNFLLYPFKGELLIRFLLFLLGFQLMYYSVYIINDLIDYPKDKLDKALAHKPLVNGSVTKSDALWLIFIHLSVGLIYFILIKDFWGLLISSFAIIYNLFYSLLFKKHWFIRYLANGFTHALRLGLPVIWAVAYGLISFNSLGLFWVSEILYTLFIANLINFRRIMDGKAVHHIFVGLYILTFIGTFRLLKTNVSIMFFFLLLLFADILILGLFTSKNILKKLRDFFVTTHL